MLRVIPERIHKTLTLGLPARETCPVVCRTLSYILSNNLTSVCSCQTSSPCYSAGLGYVLYNLYSRSWLLHSLCTLFCKKSCSLLLVVPFCAPWGLPQVVLPTLVHRVHSLNRAFVFSPLPLATVVLPWFSLFSSWGAPLLFLCYMVTKYPISKSFFLPCGSSYCLLQEMSFSIPMSCLEGMSDNYDTHLMSGVRTVIYGCLSCIFL